MRLIIDFFIVQLIVTCTLILSRFSQTIFMYSTLSLCKIKLSITFENLRGNKTICQYNETFVKGFYHAMHKLLTILVDRKKNLEKRFRSRYLTFPGGKMRL